MINQIQKNNIGKIITGRFIDVPEPSRKDALKLYLAKIYNTSFDFHYKVMQIDDNMSFQKISDGIEFKARNRITNKMEKQKTSRVYSDEFRSLGFMLKCENREIYANLLPEVYLGVDEIRIDRLIIKKIILDDLIEEYSAILQYFINSKAKIFGSNAWVSKFDKMDRRKKSSLKADAINSLKIILIDKTI